MGLWKLGNLFYFSFVFFGNLIVLCGSSSVSCYEGTKQHLSAEQKYFHNFALVVIISCSVNTGSKVLTTPMLITYTAYDLFTKSLSISVHVLVCVLIMLVVKKKYHFDI